MTPLAGALADTGQGLFEYGMDDLAQMGVMLPEPQQQLLEQVLDGGPAYAMTIALIIDPGDRYRMEQPVYAWDADNECETVFTYPMAVTLDWQLLDVEDRYRSSLRDQRGWNRFPSLPGRAHALDWCREIEEGYLDSFRIWNLWPIDGHQVDLLDEAVSEWACDSESPMGMLDLWKSVNWGDFELCDFAEMQGGGEAETHEHDEVAGPYSFDECVTGMKLFHEFEDQLFTIAGDEKVGYLRGNLPGPVLHPRLRDAWDLLLFYSQSNTLLTTHAVPPWERDDLIKTEREYSPWLWLF